ncbi:MAG: glycosyltransferase [Steroidobacteraceae bacterium]
MVVREMINCSLKLRREELRKAYAALGEPDRSGISDEMIESEREGLSAADAIFCPNRFVGESVIAYGVPAARCIDTSYGWGADRLGTHGSVIPDDGTFTVAFAGTIDVRKGAPVLLEAWVRAKIRGRLLLAGRMSREISDRFGHILRRPDVIQLGHVRNIGSVYRSADVFCFPTWEEGGPQVTLEAMSAGAVPVVTPMGTAGAFSADEDVGIVVAPGDVDALANAFHALANDQARLDHMKQRATARAADYTWERVGVRRRQELLARRRLWASANRITGGSMPAK